MCVITFNHAPYVRQCLQSIVDQQTDFDFEVIVGDDCSSDGTREIVQEFEERHPGLVTRVHHPSHVGGTRNLLSVYERAAGELIAHMDGDDYMLPGKLQAQADALDRNPDCAMCVHAMRHFDQANARFRAPISKAIPRIGDMEYLLMNLPYFAHSSKMFRAECQDALEAQGDELLDCYFHVHHALSGGTLYLPEQLGVYRLHVGISTEAADGDFVYRIPRKGMLELVVAAIEYAGRRGVPAMLVTRAKARCTFGYAYAHLLAGDVTAFQTLIRRSSEIATVSRVQAFLDRYAHRPRLLRLLVRVRENLRWLM